MGHTLLPKKLALIQLCIIGVFVSFTPSQAGMVKHWRRLLPGTPAGAGRRSMHRALVINGLGAATTALVLVIVLLTKFMHGAWIVVIAMPLVFAMMTGIRRHYDHVAQELAPPPGGVTLPSRVRVVPVPEELHDLHRARAAHGHPRRGGPEARHLGPARRHPVGRRARRPRRRAGGGRALLSRMFVHAAAACLDALGQVPAHGKIIGEEAKILTRLAGMGTAQVAGLNERFLERMREAAFEDVLTAAGLRELNRSAKALGVPDFFDDLTLPA